MYIFQSELFEKTESHFALFVTYLISIGIILYPFIILYMRCNYEFELLPSKDMSFNDCINISISIFLPILEALFVTPLPTVK